MPSINQACVQIRGSAEDVVGIVDREGSGHAN